MSFIFAFVYVSPCLSVFAADDDDDINKDGVVNEIDIIAYCAMNGYMFNTSSIETIKNSYTFSSSDSETVQTRSFWFACIALNLTDFFELSYVELMRIVSDFDNTMVSFNSQYLHSDLSTKNSLIARYTIEHLVVNRSDISNNFDSLLGYVIAPTFKPFELQEWYFTTSLNKAGIENNYDTVGSCVGYIRNLRGWDFYYPFNTFDFLKNNFVVNSSMSAPTYDVNNWAACVSRLKTQFSYMHNPPFQGEHVASTYYPIYINTYNSDLVLYKFISYGSVAYRVDEENGAFSSFNNDSNVQYFQLGAGTNADATRCLDVFITTEANSGVPIFKSTVELNSFLNGNSVVYNAPSLLDVNWDDFPWADVDFEQLSKDIIDAIKDNAGASASEIEEIIKDNIVEYLDNIDKNTAEIVKLLNKGLFDWLDRPYLKLILEKLDDLDFDIDSGDVELNIDLSDVLDKLDDIRDALSDSNASFEDIEKALENILHAQLDCNDVVDDMYDYLDELDLMLDLIESRLVAIDNKLGISNEKLDSIDERLEKSNDKLDDIIEILSQSLFDDDDDDDNVSRKINRLIIGIFPLTLRETMKTKFPFSLPFTFGYILNLFDVEAQRPSAHFEFTVLDNDIVYDFEFPAIMDNYISVFQTFCKIGFCVIMIKLSKDYILFFNDIND